MLALPMALKWNPINQVSVERHLNMPTLKLPFSSFSIIIVFFIFIIIGLAVMPLLSVKFEPSHSSNDIAVNLLWPGASSEKMEQEVTAKIEGVVATVNGIKNIRSASGNGNAMIEVELDDLVSKDRCRYEIATLIRHIYPSLPRGVYYPMVYAGGPSQGKGRPVLSYTILGNANASGIKQVAESVLKPALVLTEGIAQVDIVGATDFVWELQVNAANLNQSGLTKQDISISIYNYFQSFEVGKSYIVDKSNNDGIEYFYLTLKSDRSTGIEWHKIPVGRQAGRIVYLTDVAEVHYVEREQDTHYRINGLNTVNLEIVAAANANLITLADKIKQQMRGLEKRLPDNYSVILSYDSSIKIKNELSKIIWRASVTLLILLLFVFAVSRSAKYLLLFLLALLTNICVSFIFYYFLQLELNVYSIAGITVSMGMMINNSIVVIDHIHNKGNLRVLLAVVGSTLTSIGAVCIVFFMDEQQQVRLLDFTWVVVINLLVSLLIAVFLIPALMERMRFERPSIFSRFKRKRKVVSCNLFYAKYFRFAIRFKPALLLSVIFLFGIPVFLLPSSIESDNLFSKVYNSVLGSEFYLKSVKPWSDVALGGSLRLFITRSGKFDYSDKPFTDTYLNVSIGMPPGVTAKQMNDVVVSWENFLSQFKEIGQFQSWVYNGQSAAIEIRFKKEFEKGKFPYVLKNHLEARATYTGLADFKIYGIGDGFNNKLNTQTTNYGLTLEGYNYEKLYRYAELVKALLKKNARIEKVSIDSKRDPEGERANYEFIFKVNKPEQLLKNNVSPAMINNVLADLSTPGRTINAVLYNGSYVPVVMAPSNESATIWQVLNQPAFYDSTNFVRVKDFTDFKKEKVSNEIVRDNQQYQLVVNYNFIGDNHYATLVAEKIVEEVSQQLPIGFSMKQEKMNFWSGSEIKLTWAIFLTLLIVFIVCAVMLNSLIQSLAVIAMIPISFIGVFITSWLFEYNFDEGGYTAFIVLSGVAVNGALFILNDLNNLKEQYPNRSTYTLYIKAFNSKIVAVVLSVLSMVVGLLPFIYDPGKEPFWHPLAMSITGGLLFSMVAIFLFLPVFLKGVLTKGTRKI